MKSTGGVDTDGTAAQCVGVVQRRAPSRRHGLRGTPVGQDAEPGSPSSAGYAFYQRLYAFPNLRARACGAGNRPVRPPQSLLVQRPGLAWRASKLGSSATGSGSTGRVHRQAALPGPEDDNGFDREQLPLYIKDGKGWIKGLLRNHEAVLDCKSYTTEIGAGESSYTDYDRGVTAAACQWLGEAGARASDQSPWTLFVSWLRPHYPLVCPDKYFAMYPVENMDEAKLIGSDAPVFHPVLDTVRKNFNYDDYFDDTTRQIARAGYYGLCSFLDDQVGQVLEALEASGQLDNTLVIYTSDHGDHNGDRGLWTKMTLYEESAGIPMIMAGPDVAADRLADSPASLVDLYPTILNAARVTDSNEPGPGMDLRELAGADLPDRPILSEYHDGGSPTGMFMLRCGQWKYNEYPGFAPELFDLVADPNETNDLAASGQHADVLERCSRVMAEIVDTEAANSLAFADQNTLIEQLGGPGAILGSEEYDFTPIPSND